MKEEQICVHNFFLIKHVVKKDGTLFAIGSFVQHCFANEKIQDKMKGENIKFTYRLNDLTAEVGGEYIQHRRTEKHETDMGTMYRHTYQVKAPMDVCVELNYFPFRVVSAKLLVELSSFTSSDNETRLRPEIVLFLPNKANMFCIQKDALKEHDKNETVFEMAMDKMDRVEDLDFISPFPTVSYVYDSDKRYCPKFLLTFYMVEDGMKKFVEIVSPMFLIAGLNTLHVLNPDDESDVSTADYIANSATLALSVLVFLPNMVGTSRVQRMWTANNIYLILIFVALTLSSIPDTIAGNKYFAIFGMCLYWATFWFPIYNSMRYIRLVRKRRKMANPDDFWEGKDKDSFKPSMNISNQFAKVEEIVFKTADEQAEMGYVLREVDIFKILEFAPPKN